jgi:hypothetical protein
MADRFFEKARREEGVVRALKPTNNAVFSKK